jgi:hypothetical protein
MNALPHRPRRAGRPAAAQVIDLEQHGLPDTTIVHRGSEIGRLSVSSGNLDNGAGGDHNRRGSSI